MIWPLSFPIVLVKKYSNQEFSSGSIAWSSEWRIILFHNNDYTYNCDIIVSNFNGCALKITRKKCFFSSNCTVSYFEKKIVQKILVIVSSLWLNSQIHASFIEKLSINFRIIFQKFWMIFSQFCSLYLAKWQKMKKTFLEIHG